MATKNGNLPKKSPKLRQIHPKSRKFESYHSPTQPHTAFVNKKLSHLANKKVSQL